jgi:hypothetical protein
VLSASVSQRREVERLFAKPVAPLSWVPQPHQPRTYQVQLHTQHEPSKLASELARIGVPFEIEGDFERFLHHPGLGIKRQQLDEAGEVVIRTGQLRAELLDSNSSASEFERRLRLLEGQAWLDLLEPYRLGLVRYDQMPRAV